MVDTKVAEGNTTYTDWEGWGYSKCSHWRVHIPIHGVSGVLLASGHQNYPERTNATHWTPYPDLGIYLSDYWLADLGGMAGVGVDVPLVPLWPFITVLWTDFGVLSQAYYKVLVDTAVAALSEGKTVEVACAAGHGRTGTLVAGILATVEKLGAKDTLVALRARYCVNAVETHKQEVMLYELLDEAPPVAPVYSAGNSAVCTCGHSDHLHGKTPKSEDYLTGACVISVCECERFVNVASGALKPCVCGHSKNKHRGHLRLCVKCGTCDGYEALSTVSTTSNLSPTVCTCGHSNYAHGTLGTCQVTTCKCVEFEEQVNVIRSGNVTQYPLLPAGNTVNSAYSYRNTGVSGYTHPKVCTCGHLLSTHIYGTRNECKLCVCDRFEDSDGLPDAVYDTKAYSLPARFPRGNAKSNGGKPNGFGYK